MFSTLTCERGPATIRGISQEAKYRLMRFLLLVGDEYMAGVFEKDQASPRDAFCNQFAVACGHEAVILAVDHKRWRTEARKSAISFKRHDARDLGKVGFGLRERPPANFEVLIYSL